MKSHLRAWLTALLLALFLPACLDDAETGDEQNASAVTGTFETFVGEDGLTYFQLVAKNGERILGSQGYKSLSSAKSGITSVRTNGKDAARFKVLPADNGEFYFNLVAKNGQVIGTSETYVSKSNADKGVQAVIKALQTPSSGAADATGAKFETFKGADAKWYFRLRAKNGQIVLQSQGYSSKSSANGGVTSVKSNGVDASNFNLVEGADGQHTFNLKAQNGKIIARGEMYVTKSNAVRGAGRAREIIREVVGSGSASDADIQKEIETAASGLLYISESEAPFGFVQGGSSLGAPVTQDLVRAELSAFVDQDAGADKPLATLFGMEAAWTEWKAAEHNCSDPEDPGMVELCQKMRDLEQVLESNLTDVRVFYFGGSGTPGDVQGIGVSIFIVGRTPAGTLAGVRTLAIWT